MSNDDARQRQLSERMQHYLGENGQMVEAGWADFLRMAAPDASNPDSVRFSRWIFFSGAMHVFNLMHAILDRAETAGEAEFQLMDSLADELQRFLDAVEHSGEGRN